MAQPVDPAPSPAVTLRGALARGLVVWIGLPLFFLVSGGSLDWWQAWVYSALLLIPMTAFVVWMARRDPAFIARRLKLREREPTQRRLLAWGYPLFLAAFVLPGLDHRLGWSRPPLAVVVAALLLVLGGYLLVLRSFVENRWAGRTVETSAEQRVVASGPYAVVRHPMYVGTLVMYLASPVALGSWWALLPALGFAVIIVLRIRHEEQLLVRELPGYAAYQQQVRHRLLPGLW